MVISIMFVIRSVGMEETRNAWRMLVGKLLGRRKFEDRDDGSITRRGVPQNYIAVMRGG
jgi:hypothetical protein